MATLKPGEIIERHSHSTMHEFFYVLSGSVDITAEGDPSSIIGGKFVCPKNCFFHAAPGDAHSFEVFADASSELKMIVIGLTTGPPMSSNN